MLEIFLYMVWVFIGLEICHKVIIPIGSSIAWCLNEWNLPFLSLLIIIIGIGLSGGLLFTGAYLIYYFI